MWTGTEEDDGIWKRYDENNPTRSTRSKKLIVEIKEW